MGLSDGTAWEKEFGVDKKTPCQELGYKSGDLFEVVQNTGNSFSVGSIVKMVGDDGSATPYFSLVSGSCCNLGNKGHCKLEYLKPLPTEDFKMDMSIMTETEKSVAKDWLQKVAKGRGIDGSTIVQNYPFTVNYIWVYSDGVYTDFIVAEENAHYRSIDLPEVTLYFTTPKLEGWELLSKDYVKKKQLQQVIDKLKTIQKETSTGDTNRHMSNDLKEVTYQLQSIMGSFK